MVVCLIVAASENGVIGKANQLPWHIPEDLRYFKTVTSGKTVIMGRKTFESIGRPLPNRRNIVITRQADFKPDGVEVVSSLAAALSSAEKTSAALDEVFIVGGGEIYRESLGAVRRAYVTEVHQTIDGDAFFPLDQLKKEFQLISRKDFSNPLPFSFMVYERS
jgi:dihydrofolate reductase